MLIGVLLFSESGTLLTVSLSGGQLRIAHKGNEMVYDWSSENPQSITWAAFFSDCEHEVLEVTSGHRVTLTYNLFMSSFPSSVIGGVLGKSLGTNNDPTMYPLHARVKSLLDEPSFFTNGM